MMKDKLVKTAEILAHAFGRVVIFLVLLILAISFLYPLYYMLINSLKSLGEYYVNPFGLPQAKLEWQNFVTMISQFKILRLFGNSFIISFFTVLGLVVIRNPRERTRLPRWTSRVKTAIYLDDSGNAVCTRAGHDDSDVHQLCQESILWTATSASSSPTGLCSCRRRSCS